MLLQTYEAWDDDALAALFGQYDVFLNLHKNCANRDAPIEAFRVALLLDAGKLVLSERGPDADEAEYAGLATFARPRAIPALHSELVRRGSVGYREQQRHVHALFRSRFAPQRIFERAGVYADWGLQQVK